MPDADARAAYNDRLGQRANDYLRRQHEEQPMPEPAIPAELPTPVRAAMARLDLATRALPRDMQQNVFELAEEIYRRGRAQAVAVDGACYSVWLHGDDRWLTKQMTTEQREAFADAVDRFAATVDPAEPAAMDRWWRDA